MSNSVDNMSGQELTALRNKFKVWKILHSGEKTHYCDHCKYINTKFSLNEYGQGTCSSFINDRRLALLGFCHIFLMEGNYVK